MISKRGYFGHTLKGTVMSHKSVENKGTLEEVVVWLDI